MKPAHTHIILLITIFLLHNHSVLSQKNKTQPLDSALEANSEKWKVKLHKGFGKGRPEFGPFYTIEIKKLDSLAFRKTTKEGSYTGATITNSSWDWDFSKYEKVENKKVYRMTVGNAADTAEMLFSYYKVFHDKQLTFFGELMSKDDEGKNVTLAYKKDVSGIVTVGIDAIPWRFFMEDTFSRDEGQTANPIGPTAVSRMYVITGEDSLFTEPIMHQVGKPGGKYFWEWQKGLFVKNGKGDRLAALKFGTAGDLSNPFYVWIRKDIDPSIQHAIGSLFALLIIARTD